MDPKLALLLAPLLIWGAVFAFVWSVDRRVRALERRVREQERTPTLPPANGRVARDKEMASR